MNNMKKNRHTKRYTYRSRGFTLVETFVAISILVVAIVGPMTIAARGLQSAFFARDQMTAVYLGQEAVEIIRSVRDQNALLGQSWLAGIPASCSSGDGCGIDVRDGSFRACAPVSNCQLLYDDSPLAGNRGVYTYESGTPSVFTRVIHVEETSADQEAEITVEISWQSPLTAKTVTVQSLIFNQYDNL